MISFKHNFPRSGEEWTADANYTRGTTTSMNPITFLSLRYSGWTTYRVSINNRQIHQETMNILLHKPISPIHLQTKSKLEAGGRVAIRNIGNLNNFNTVDSEGNLIYQPLLVFKLLLSRPGACGICSIFKYRWQLWFSTWVCVQKIQVIRGSNSYAEQDEANPGGLKDTLGTFSNNYPISLFPSIFLTEKLNGDHRICN